MLKHFLLYKFHLYINMMLILMKRESSLNPNLYYPTSLLLSAAKLQKMSLYSSSQFLHYHSYNFLQFTFHPHTHIEMTPTLYCSIQWPFPRLLWSFSKAIMSPCWINFLHLPLNIENFSNFLYLSGHLFLLLFNSLAGEHLSPWRSCLFVSSWHWSICFRFMALSTT